MAASPSSTLIFPHPILTPIVGKPTNKSLQLTQKELFTNARAVNSTRGGGANGHLAIIMPAAAYLARTGVPFVPQVHPGVAPVHPPLSTGNQITEINRQFAANIRDHTLYSAVQQGLKAQILAATEQRYLQVLEDADMGFADVTASAMLAHLKLTYGTITPKSIEENRQLLGADWNPDSAMEDTWLKIIECQRQATAANEPIQDLTAIRLVLDAFERSGVFTNAVEKWNDKVAASAAHETMANFQLHFDHENDERVRKLTAQTAGFHGANNTTSTPTTDVVPPSPGTAAAVTPHVDIGNGTKMYYCWSHGLGKNEQHTSATCSNKKEGHKTDATADKMKGGNNTISGGFRGPRRPTS
jgi:hypothetical protein